MLCFSLATLENIIRIIRRTIFPSYIECKCSMYICQVMVFSSIPPPMKAVLREHVSSFDFLSENQKKSEKLSFIKLWFFQEKIHWFRPSMISRHSISLLMVRIPASTSGSEGRLNTGRGGRPIEKEGGILKKWTFTFQLHMNRCRVPKNSGMNYKLRTNVTESLYES